MTYLKTQNKPRIHNLPLSSQRGDLNDYGVRAYRASPQDAMLQLRLPNRYVTVALSETECRTMAQALLIAADELAAFKK